MKWFEWILCPLSHSKMIKLAEHVLPLYQDEKQTRMIYQRRWCFFLRCACAGVVFILVAFLIAYWPIQTEHWRKMIFLFIVLYMVLVFFVFFCGWPWEKRQIIREVKMMEFFEALFVALMFPYLDEWFIQIGFNRVIGAALGAVTDVIVVSWSTILVGKLGRVFGKAWRNK